MFLYSFIVITRTFITLKTAFTHRSQIPKVILGSQRMHQRSKEQHGNSKTERDGHSHKDAKLLENEHLPTKKEETSP